MVNFEKLTPRDDADIEVYQRALDYAFEEDDITNIAISGPYGAGKSTVIQSYFKLRPEHKAEFIALAHFDEHEKSTLDSQTLANRLEAEIISQLAHSPEIFDACDSRFVPRIKPHIEKVVWNTFIGFLTIALALAVAGISGGSFLANLSVASKDSLQAWLTIIALLCGAHLAYQAYFVMRRNYQIRKISTSKLSVDVDDATSDSVFDKYLPDVLYLFEQSGSRIFVFEDLDRYDNVKIYEQLRKVNYLLNKRRSPSEVYRFIYLVRDGLFSKKDRTKFFDFILPVIPYVESKNSLDLLTRRLGHYNLETPSLSQLSLHIDDMRTLTNICNEFEVYWHRIGSGTQLDAQKMFSFVVYKNLYPKDYDCLCCGAGSLRLLFEIKKQLILATIESADENPYATNTPRENQSIAIAMQSSTHASKLAEATIVQGLQASGCITLPSTAREFPASPLSPSDYPTATHNDPKGRELDEWEKYQIKPLLTMIENGYIDETYHDYLSYFHEERYSRSDRAFVLSVIDNRPLGYDHKLTDIDKLVEDLTDADLQKPASLNHFLFEHALDQSEGNRIANAMISCIVENREIAFLRDFVDHQIQNERTGIAVKALKLINRRDESLLLDWIIAEDGTTTDSQHSPLEALFLCVVEKSQIKGDKRLGLKEHFENSDVLLDELAKLDTPLFEQAIENLSTAEVVFSDLGSREIPTKCLDAIYNASLFPLDQNTVEYLFEKYIGHQLNWERSVAELEAHREKPLGQYIFNALDDYINLSIEIAGKLRAPKEVFVSLLNNVNLSDSTKKSLIQATELTTFDLDDIDESWVREELVRAGQAAPSTANLIQLINNSTYEILYEFLSHTTRITIDEFMGALEENEAHQVVAEISTCEATSNEVLEAVARAIEYPCSNFTLREISRSRMLILIECRYIEMSNPNYSLMRTAYPDLLIPFVEANLHSFLSLAKNSITISPEEIVSYITSDQFGDNEKVSLAECYDGVIRIGGLNLTKPVLIEILEHHFDSSDLRHIFSLYSNASNELQESIVNVTRRELAHNADCIAQMPLALARKLITSRGLEPDMAIRIVEFTFAQQDLLLFLDVCRKARYRSLRDIARAVELGGRPSIPNTQNAVHLLYLLEERKWISSFKVDGESIKIYGFAQGAPELSEQELRN